ncbi:hypothetical protein AB0C52_23590 [Streptomyces sp. NPDC048717]|uniref:hypothetical protein n=1 Tax=Streptomyces sp. NPDC048717 TaxID=3154928 RepID=UPI00342F4CC3
MRRDPVAPPLLHDSLRRGGLFLLPPEIQRRHGGAWILLCHLPVVFTCPRHQVFLHETCPR